MKKKRIRLIIAIVVLVIIVGVIIFLYNTFRMRFNDTYVNGNSAGNLYNSGTFCESGDTIFFANPDDGNKLYSMKTDGTKLKKMCDDSITFINADEHYVYYTRADSGANEEFSFLHFNTHSLCRIRRDGFGEAATLDNRPCLFASLSGNYLYYLPYDTTDATTLYKVKIDGTNMKKVSQYPYFTCSTNGQYIFYNGLKGDHNIYRFDTTRDTQSVLYKDNCWMPIVTDDESTAYFMDCSSDYNLAKVDLTNGTKQILCDYRVDFYNICGNYIYFQTSIEDPALYRMKTDGTECELVKAGTHHDINVTSTYVYFTDYYSETVYRVPTGATSPIEPFHPGVD